MSQIVKLPEELTIYGVSQLHQAMLGCLAEQAPALTVEASTVSEVDASGIQLLLSLQHTLSQSQRQLVIMDPSESLRSACEFFGVADQLFAHATQAMPS